MTPVTYPIAGGGAMPGLGLGTWKSEHGVERVVSEALRVGYRHFDCAWIYGNEAQIGKALRRALDGGEVRREELWITSKLWNDMHEPEQVRRALERSLDLLGLERLDLYLMHWPVALVEGVLVPRAPEDFRTLLELPLDETWSAMEACRAAGLSRAIGVSNFSVKKLAGLLDRARVPPAVNQVEVHPFLVQTELIDYCRRAGVHVTAYSPLGSVDRPPQLTRAAEPSLLAQPVVRSIADKHGCTAAQVLIAWPLHRGLSVIPKTARPERLRENLAAAELRLDEDDLLRLAALDRGFRYVHGEFWVVDGGPYTIADLWDETD